MIKSKSKDNNGGCGERCLWCTVGLRCKYNVWPETLHWLVGYWAMLCSGNSAIGEWAGFLLRVHRATQAHAYLFIHLSNWWNKAFGCVLSVYKIWFGIFLAVANAGNISVYRTFSPPFVPTSPFFFFNPSTSTFDPKGRSLTGSWDAHTCLGVRGQAPWERFQSQRQAPQRQTNLSQ